MKLKGYTQIGILTALLILFYQVLMIKLSLQNSGLVALQYAFLFLGIFISIFVYNRANKLVILDLFMIGFRTLSTAVILLVLGSLFFYFYFFKWRFPIYHHAMSSGVSDHDRPHIWQLCGVHNVPQFTFIHR